MKVFDGLRFCHLWSRPMKNTSVLGKELSSERV